MAKIISYIEVKSNDYLEDKIIKTQCISLKDIDSFSVNKKLTDKEYEIIKEDGFELVCVDKKGRCIYAKRI